MFEPTHVGCYEVTRVHDPQCMHRVPPVSSTHGRDARATITPHRFLVPMRGIKVEGALHEPGSSGRQSAHSSLEMFEPTHVGCCEVARVHDPQCMHGVPPVSSTHGRDARATITPAAVERRAFVVGLRSYSVIFGRIKFWTANR